MRSFSLDPLWWLWLPLLAMTIQIVLEIFLPGDVLGALHSEWGPHETLQFVVIAIAFLIGLTTLPRIEWKTRKDLGAWIVLATLCCLYVAGEELSWGQHVFQWGTPKFWHTVNDQNETNLHNISSWFDQKPRLILLIGIIVGGIVIPILQKYYPARLPSRFDSFYPPASLFVPALFCAVPQLVEKLGEAMEMPVFARVSEVQELYMFYFVALYLWALRSREFAKQDL